MTLEGTAIELLACCAWVTTPAGATAIAFTVPAGAGTLPRCWEIPDMVDMLLIDERCQI